MGPTPLQGAGAGGSHLLDKQSLVPVVQELWNAWEIHFLILVSLSLQVFLFLFAGMRRRSSNWFLQTILWLAYLSADSVAVFVLGNLAVHAREPGHELLSFWAPFVLVHLGGQDTITAFSKQDNELWRRHLLNLVIQVAVAGYVVAKASWPDIWLRAAMALMFLCGCFKYGERTVCLYFADTENVRQWTQYNLWVTQLYGNTRTKAKREEAKQDMGVTLDMMSKGSSAEPPSQIYGDAVKILEDTIAVDAPLNKPNGVTLAACDDLPDMLHRFLSSESRHNAYEHVGELLEFCYRRLYTKDPLRLYFTLPFDHPSPILKACIRIGCLSFILFMLVSTAAAASVSLALFRAAEKRDQLHASSRVDIMVTYALLVGAIVLDVASASIFLSSLLSFYLPCKANGIQSACCTKQWSQDLGQYNIINTADMSSVRQQFGQDVKCTPVTKDHTSIKKFILDTLLASGTRKEWSIASTRGQLALHKWMERHHSAHLAMTTTLQSLEETITSSADFPTSVLILHIATDICYHYGGGTDSDHQAVKKHKQTSTQLSNYIMYLVFKCGVMLTTNSQVVHDIVRREIGDVLSQHPKVDPRNKDATVMKLFEAIKKRQQERQDSMSKNQVTHQESEEVSGVETENEQSTDFEDNADDDYMKKLKRSSQTLKAPLLPRAIAVAQELVSINDEAERWDLIATVWAEMLYYTAPRCGGGFHYEHLSTGGEFVTHVLILMYHLGPFLPPPS